MQELLRNKLRPFHVLPGDTITVYHEIEVGDVKTTTTLGTYVMREEMTIDRLIIVKHEEDELTRLHLKSAVGVIFGESL